MKPRINPALRIFTAFFDGFQKKYRSERGFLVVKLWWIAW
jgi:hypothetical protein